VLGLRIARVNSPIIGQLAVSAVLFFFLRDRVASLIILLILVAGGLLSF